MYILYIIEHLLLNFDLFKGIILILTHLLIFMLLHKIFTQIKIKKLDN